MTFEQLRKIHQARPFKPFALHLADGRSLEVRHPENMAYAGPARTIAVFAEPDAAEIIDLLLVTSLRPLRNGSRSKHN